VAAPAFESFNMLDHSCQTQRHPHAERGLDLYETPDVAVSALLRVEQLPARIWEPAAGHGSIVRVLRDAGHNVITSDIHDYGGLDFVRDFLTETKMPTDTTAEPRRHSSHSPSADPL
jgi:hypothetical protein